MFVHVPARRVIDGGNGVGLTLDGLKGQYLAGALKVVWVSPDGKSVQVVWLPNEDFRYKRQVGAEMASLVAKQWAIAAGLTTVEVVEAVFDPRGAGAGLGLRHPDVLEFYRGEFRRLAPELDALQDEQEKLAVLQTLADRLFAFWLGRSGVAVEADGLVVVKHAVGTIDKARYIHQERTLYVDVTAWSGDLLSQVFHELVHAVQDLYEAAMLVNRAGRAAGRRPVADGRAVPRGGERFGVVRAVGPEAVRLRGVGVADLERREWPTLSLGVPQFRRGT